MSAYPDVKIRPHAKVGQQVSVNVAMSVAVMIQQCSLASCTSDTALITCLIDRDPMHWHLPGQQVLGCIQQAHRHAGMFNMTINKPVSDVSVRPINVLT